MLSVLGTALLSLLSALWPILPRAAALVPMAAQFAGAAAVLGIVALVMRRFRLAIIAAVALGWNLVSIWPDIAPDMTARATATPALTVISFNIWYHNPDIDRTIDALAASGADVIGLVETTPRMMPALLKLRAVYPYGSDCVVTAWNCQTVLFSKYPLKNSYAGSIDDRLPDVAIAEVDKPGSAPITVAVTHLDWPLTGRVRPPLVATAIGRPDSELPDVPALEQSVQAANLVAFLARRPEDLVLMGDFNSASWSPVIAALRRATGLQEHRRLLPSWPTWAWPIFRLPIDHVLARGKARVVDIALGPAIGSDHLPLVAKIAIAP
jgi:endonuclease/exonuclease/phosphatase (EEP) superfamily protein YafD